MGIFDGFAGAAVGALGGLLGSTSANKESAASTQAQIDFQREMSNTAYQRAVADLNAAGLSPMLAYSQGGASAPQGASYKAENVGASAVEGAAKGSQPSLLKAQVEQAQSQAQLNVASAKQVAEQARKTAYEVDTMLPTQLLYDAAVKGSQITANNAGALASTANARNTNATAVLTEEGKAVAPDTSIVRNLKDAYKYGISMPNQFFNDMIGNLYQYGKSKFGVKK